MDAEEFDEFYSASPLVGQIYAMVGNREEAQECVQEAFVRAWARRRQLEQARTPEAWVRTTAYRLAVSRWRRVVLARRAPDRAVQPGGTTAAPSSDHVAVVAALRQLPASQRRAIVLHHLCDLPVSAVATEVGVPVGTIKARLSRGRAALSALLGEGLDDEAAEGVDHV